MLFQANITAKTLQSEETLAEQLYIFLEQYVPNRLRYESTDEKEDCIQDTIMFLLKRYRQLDIEELRKINVEQFFYNRAHSFISLYLRKLSNARKKQTEFIRKQIYVTTMSNAFIEELDLVDMSLLRQIILGYQLTTEYADALGQLTLDKLSYLGYVVSESEPLNLREDVLGTLEALSFAVIDEYMFKSIETEGEVHSQHDEGI